MKDKPYEYLGDPSVDSHARFNLSPVPSMDDDDEDNQIDHQHQRNLPNIDQDDAGEESELMNGTRTATTTVQMLDSMNNPPGDQHDVEGLIER